MFAGPIFSREALTTPRQLKHFLIRAGYIALLFVLMYTAGQATFGWQQVRNLGDLARFGSLILMLFSVVQLTLILFFALLFSAGYVAQEKDRRTLVLLLMTDLKDRELVFGKMLSSLLNVGVLLFVSIPVFTFLYLLGGVSLPQIVWSIAICGTAAFAAASWGSLVAFWREKTFQTLAISVLGLVVFIGVVEAILFFIPKDTVAAAVVGLFNPLRTLLMVVNPFLSETPLGPANLTAFLSVMVMLLLAGLLNLVSIKRLRVWNPSRIMHEAAKDKDDAEQKRARTRKVWNLPIIWREIRTRAYGRKAALIKLCYLALAAFVFYSLPETSSNRLILGMVTAEGAAFLGLSLLSFLLINAQAVTSITTERDAQTLELLLVTDITAKEFIWGKLGGALINAKELIAVPLLFVIYYYSQGRFTLEPFIYLCIGFGVLVLFSGTLGLHSGLSFENSRSAIANSLGTNFFLFVGIFIFMMLLVETRSSFLLQFQSFLVFILVGSIGLWASLTHKNPSPALTLSAAVLPFLTFYAITEFLLSGTLGVTLSIATAYGFTTLAMLIPAISEFDVALGRSTLDRG